MSTEVTALLSSTFAHCVALQCIWLPPRLMQIGKEVFLNCIVLQEVVIPTELSDVRIYSTEERRLHTTCLETAKKAMENFGLFE